ncbi:MAG: HXXEE domain-containing protein [Terracidiphilus sp.]
MSPWTLSFRTLEWLFPIVVTLHNSEEAIWLPDWWKRSGIWHGRVTPRTFRCAAVVLTFLTYAVTWLSVMAGRQSVWTYLAFGCIAATLANVLVPHLAVAIAMRCYVPGVATAVLLNLPVLTLLAVYALREGYVSGWKAVAFCIGVTGALVALIPALFKLGKILNL